MILKIAWRNIWRNRTRSVVVITAIAIGLWAGVFSSAFVVGMMNQKVESVMQLELSHFHVHHPDFGEEMLPKFTIPQKDKWTLIFNTEEDAWGSAHHAEFDFKKVEMEF